MQINEMIEANNRLENYYEKEITAEQSNIMFEELKEMPIEKYKEAIAICIRTSKYMPKIADIISASKTIDNTNYNNEKKQYEKCNKCNGTGYITYYKTITDGDRKLDYQYGARCICENGNNANQNIPTYIELGVQPGERIFAEMEIK